MELLQVYVNEFVVKAIRFGHSIDKLTVKNIFDDHEHRMMLSGQLEELQKMCVDGELPMTKITVDHILFCLNCYDDPKKPAEEKQLMVASLSGDLLANYLSTVRDRLGDELSTKIFFQLPYSRKVLFEKPKETWEPIIERFPETVMDIEESAKCFVLSRYAASVFHAIQVIEHGLIALGTFLSVKDPISGWTAVANELKRIVSKNYRERTDFEKQYFPFIEQMQATVEALKNAWRNKISHAQGRLILMSADFSPDITEEIRTATRAFMRRLATDLPK